MIWYILLAVLAVIDIIALIASTKPDGDAMNDTHPFSTTALHTTGIGL